MGDETANIGYIPAEMSKDCVAEAYDRKCAERRRAYIRDKARIIAELSYERRELCKSISNLKDAIKENPEEISFEQKKLWRLQYDAMLAYKDALDKRIVNIIEESKNDYNIDDKDYNL